MKLMLVSLFTLMVSHSTYASSICAELKCQSGQTKVEVKNGFECRKTGTNLRSGPFCTDRGFYKNDTSLGRVIERGSFKIININNRQRDVRNGNFTTQIGAVVTKEQGFKEGNYHGKKILRDERTGQVLEEGSFKDGKGHGSFKIFDKNKGLVLEEEIWMKGRLENRIRFTYDKEGKKKKIETLFAGKDVTYTELFDDGEIKKKEYKEDDVVLWVDNGKGKVLSKHPREIGSCKIVKEENNSAYKLSINGEIFAYSLVELPLLKAMEKAKETCHKFSKDQSIKGCQSPKLMESQMPNAEFEVGDGLKAIPSIGGLLLEDAIEATHMLSKAGLCQTMSANKCHATFVEPADENAKDGFKISLKQSDKTYELEPKSKRIMYYISRVLFSTKCKKTYSRGNKCHITSIDHDKASKEGSGNYKFELGDTEVFSGRFYDADKLLVGWNSKLCGGEPVNKCELVEKVEGVDVSYYLMINGEKACDGKSCSYEYLHINKKEKEKETFQNSMMSRYPQLVLDHGCFFKDSFGESFLNGVADSFITTNKERLREELRRSIASKKLDVGESETTDSSKVLDQ